MSRARKKESTLPKSGGLAKANSDNSSNVRTSLGTYIQFLTVAKEINKTTLLANILNENPTCSMAAIFNAANRASPLAYPASQTALMILDFQGYCVDRCGSAGRSALSRATAMRDWAFENKVMVIHSLFDVKSTPAPTRKGSERIVKLLEGLANDRAAAEEAPEIAFNKNEGEYIVFKRAGTVSALKSAGAMELLTEHGIKSLIICGISTSNAVFKTTVAALDDGYIVSVIHDASSDPSEKLHDVVVKDMLSSAHVATAEEFINAWAGK